MAEALKRVADAVVGLLETGEAAGTFSQAILTVRRWLFLKNLEDLAGISVQVVPIGSVRERDSNTTFERYVRCDVLCKKQVPQTVISDSGIERDWIDAHVAILEEIDDYLGDDGTATRDPADDIEYVEPGDKRAPREILSKLGIEFFEEALIENLFFGVVRVAYRVRGSY